MPPEASPQVLVCGGAGYIGSHVVLALQDAGYGPVVLDDLSTGRRDMVPGEVPFVTGDARDYGLLSGVLQQHGCAAVMHFAGSVVVPESVEQPLDYYDNNVVTSLRLLQACREFGVGAFIFSSTAAVYAGDGRPVSENTPLDPASPYGRSKLMVEWMLRDMAAAHDMRFGILRYFNVAGADPRQRAGQCSRAATHLIKRACQAALGQIPAIQVFGTDYATPDGTAVRDYIHVTDLADAHVAVLRHLLDGNASCTLNCGYGAGYSVYQVLEAVDRVHGRPVPRQIAPRRAGDAESLVADSTRLRQQLGWQPQHDDLDHIVDTALRWERRLASDAEGA